MPGEKSTVGSAKQSTVKTIRPFKQSFDIGATKRILTSEVSAEISRVIEDMQDVRFRAGVEIDFTPDDVAWYIAYKT